MPIALAAYITHLDNTLATAVDAATWTTAIKEQAFRMALETYDPLIAYEVSHTVTVAGHAQDLSALTAIKQVLHVYYPWDDHGPLQNLPVNFRFTGSNTLWIDHAEPKVGEKIRIRYLKHHVIQNLDAGAATTVADLDAIALSTFAAAWACMLRARQLSENPAPPREAIRTLEKLATSYTTSALQMIRPLHPSPIAWSQMGLDL